MRSASHHRAPIPLQSSAPARTSVPPRSNSSPRGPPRLCRELRNPPHSRRGSGCNIAPDRPADRHVPSPGWRCYCDLRQTPAARHWQCRRVSLSLNQQPAHFQPAQVAPAPDELNIFRNQCRPSDHRDVPDHNPTRDRKSTRLNSSHLVISYAVFCLKKKKKEAAHVLLTQSITCMTTQIM